MRMFGKIKKRVMLSVKIDNLTTFCCWMRFKFPRNVSFHIYPNSIINISHNSVFRIDNGEFVVNDSWFDDRARRYKSELRIDENATFICEGDFKLFQGASIYVAPNAKLVLKGGWSFLNTNSTLNCFNYIEIGKGCSISDNVSIQDSDNHSIDGDESKVSAPIIIKDHVWIGKNVIILKGVTIGEGAVVGAGSIVTKDVAPKSVVAGNPAKVIRENVIWE